MIRAANPPGDAADLPRRELCALLPYLDCEVFGSRPALEQAMQVEAMLQRLAAASRMQ